MCIRDSLITYNGFREVLKFVKEVRDLVSVHDSILIVPVDPGTLGRRRLKLVERGMIVVRFSRFPPHDIISVYGINREAFRRADGSQF